MEESRTARGKQEKDSRRKDDKEEKVAVVDMSVQW